MKDSPVDVVYSRCALDTCLVCGEVKPREGLVVLQRLCKSVHAVPATVELQVHLYWRRRRRQQQSRKGGATLSTRQKSSESETSLSSSWENTEWVLPCLLVISVVVTATCVGLPPLQV